jgi:hypothetical protein
MSETSPNDFVAIYCHRFSSQGKRGGLVVIRTFPKDSLIFDPRFHAPGVYFGENITLPFLCVPFINDRVVDAFGFPISVRLALVDLSGYVRKLRHEGFAPANDLVDRFNLKPNWDVIRFDDQGYPDHFLTRYSNPTAPPSFPGGVPAGPLGWEPQMPSDKGAIDLLINLKSIRDHSLPYGANPDASEPVDLNDCDLHELVHEPPAAHFVPIDEPREVRTSLQPVVSEPSSSRHGSVLYRIASGRLGRNDPCFCGSGRKFKRCCLSAPDESVLINPGIGGSFTIAALRSLLDRLPK